ncbi:transposable element Tc3 transposase [Trichonephila clavipes]|nr:transposable element Tc3 transposase [Trichonephila clavipes]
MQLTGNHQMARIVRHNDESVREGYISNGGKEVTLFINALKEFQCSNRIVMAQRKHLDDFYEVELLDGWNVDIPSWKYPRNFESLRRFQDDGNVSRCYSTGRPRVTTPNEDVYIWQLLPKETDGAQHQTCLVSSLQLPVRQLQDRPCTDALGPLVYMLVGLFSLQSDSHRTLIWRAPGTRYHQENTIERYRYGGARWLAWGEIILGSRTDLHVQSVTMTDHNYRDVILEQHVRLFRGPMGAEFLFMDYNARLHHANIVDECLQSEDITRMDWTAYSSDLNPIEHVWDMLGRRIAAHQPPPTCLSELRRALLDEWCNIPQDQIDNLIPSMPRRCKACIASSGRHTPN